jgi:hypothetical protein
MTIETIILLSIYVALVIVLGFIIKRRRKTYHFDEMQERIRAKGYKIAYFTTLILLCGLIVADTSMGMEIPPYALSGLIIVVVMVSFLVWGIYCIIHDSFFFLGQNWRDYFIVCLIVGFVQGIALVSGLMGWIKEEVHTQSFFEMIFTKVSTSGVMAITFLTLAAVVGIKMLSNRNAVEE